MRSLKPILSVFLLLTYLVGIGHEFLPHSHADEAGTKETHNEHGHLHGHHYHAEGDVVDHTHLAHQDHFDDGLFDLLICILSETDHSDEDVHYVLPIEVNQARNKDLNKAKLVAVLVSFIPFIELSTQTESCSGFIKDGLVLAYQTASPLRGPPVIS